MCICIVIYLNLGWAAIESRSEPNLIPARHRPVLPPVPAYNSVPPSSAYSSSQFQSHLNGDCAKKDSAVSCPKKYLNGQAFCKRSTLNVYDQIEHLLRISPCCHSHEIGGIQNNSIRETMILLIRSIIFG